MKRSKIHTRIWMALIVLAAATTANAAIVIWDGYGGDDDWFTPMNWSDDAVPQPSDLVSVTDAVVVAGAPITVDAGEVVLTGSDLHMLDLVVGDLAGGRVELSSTGLSTSITRIATFEDSAAGVLVRDGSGWTTDWVVTVGASGSGALTVTGGSGMQSASGVVGLFHRSKGEVTLDGGLWICENDLTVGMYGDGFLNVKSFSSVVATMGVVGFGATGVVEVSPYAALTFSDGLVVGQSGYAEINVIGGTLSSGTAVVGSKWDLMGPGDGRVRLSRGGRWINAGEMYIGERGRGEVRLEDGAYLSAGDIYVGYGGGARDGELTLDGGSRVEADNLIIGCDAGGGVGVWRGELIVAGRLDVGHQAGSYGALQVEGLVKADELRLGGDGGDASLELGSDGVIEVSSLLAIGSDVWFGVSSGGQIFLNGASMTDESDHWYAEMSIDRLRLAVRTEGDNEVTLEAAHHDRGAAMHEAMYFAGNFEIGQLIVGHLGTARVKLVNESDNHPGEDWSEAMYVDELVLRHNSRLDLNGINLYYRTLVDEGGTIVTDNGGSMQKIHVAGDVDDDDDVDLEDFVILKQNFNTPDGATREQGDLNGDGAVDMDDFVILKQNFDN